MDIPGLTAEVEAEVRDRFGEEEAALILDVLASTSLPFLDDVTRIRERARVHMAVLKLADGTLAGFDRALQLAQIDWRDALVTAGLGNEDWPDVLASHGFRVPGG